MLQDSQLECCEDNLVVANYQKATPRHSCSLSIYSMIDDRDLNLTWFLANVSRCRSIRKWLALTQTTFMWLRENVVDHDLIPFTRSTIPFQQSLRKEPHFCSKSRVATCERTWCITVLFYCTVGMCFCTSASLAASTRDRSCFV